MIESEGRAPATAEPVMQLYLTLVVGAALATALALAPVSVHRALFRQGAKSQIVTIGSRLAIVTLLVVALPLAVRRRGARANQR